MNMKGLNTTGGVTTKYRYNVDGLRTGKKVGNTWTRYFWDGDRIIRDNRSGTYMDFYYDEAGQAVSVRVKTGSSGPETFYYYGRNIFGDIVEIYDASGSVVAKYTYNAWGEVLSITDASGNAITSGTHIGNLNPLRYRGYYYDSETGFYYLQSRYYDPVMKRFLNADGANTISASQKELINKNLFAYGDNNPVIRADCQGDFWGLVILAVVVGGLISGGLEIAKQKSEGKSWGEIDYIDVAIETMNGMISGALFAVAASIPAVC